MKAVGIILGVLTAIFGIYAMTVPFKTFLGIGWILGILFFMNGVENVISALSQEKKDGWKCVLGILTGLAGLYLLFSGVARYLTDVMVIYIVGACVLLYGVFSIVSGVKTYKEAKGHSIIKIVCGILSIIVGLISIAHPAAAMVYIGYLIAAALIIQGINTVILTVSISKIVEKAEEE